MILATSDALPGYELVDIVGLVRGSSVRSRHIGKDISAKLRNLVGGEVLEYTKLLAEVREQALDRMVSEARALGADAIVAVRYASSEISRGAAEILVYGTAVRIRRLEPSTD